MARISNVLPKGKCAAPGCGKLIALTKAGTLRWHLNGETKGECAGTWSLPVS